MNSLFARVVFRDALARSWAVFLAISCMLLAVTSVAGVGGLEAVRSVLLLVALFFGVVMVMRAATVSALLMRGTQAEGTVNGDSGEVGMTSYSFIYENTRFEGKVFMAAELDPGQKVTVAFDPNRPEVSVIEDIFI